MRSRRRRVADRLSSVCHSGYSGDMGPVQVLEIIRSESDEPSGRLSFVDIGGVHVPERFDAKLFADGHLCWASFDLGDGQIPQLKVIRFGTRDLDSDAGLTDDVLQSFRLDDIKKAVIEYVGVVVRRGDEPTPITALTGGALRAAERAAAGAAGRRRNRVTHAHLVQVAEVYRAAAEKGEPPRIAVRDHFRTSDSTAARWIGLARADRLLGSARKGRSGEGEGAE